MEDRRKRILIGGVELGLALGVAFDILLSIVQRYVDFLVVNGGISGSFQWSPPAAPISILTSPKTLLLGILGGVVVGFGAGLFAAALIPEAAAAADS